MFDPYPNFSVEKSIDWEFKFQGPGIAKSLKDSNFPEKFPDKKSQNICNSLVFLSSVEISGFPEFLSSVEFLNWLSMEAKPELTNFPVMQQVLSKLAHWIGR